MSEKSELPSPKRLAEARKRGQIARSRLLSSAAVMTAGFLGLSGGFALAFSRLKLFATRAFLGQLTVPSGLGNALWLTAATAAVPLGAALFTATAVSFGFAGFRAGGGELVFKLERLNPADGFKRIFSASAWLELAKGLLVAAVLGVWLFLRVRARGPSVLHAVQTADGVHATLGVLRLVGQLALEGGLLLLALGGFDYLLQRRQHLKSLMMTREEVKREHKDSDGDPHHKAKRKSVHRQLAQGGPARGVQKANVVVVNPTHLAVALRYDDAEADAPYLVAKAREEEALALRREATRLGIPIVRDIPLARSLIHYDVGEEIPEELYQAAAAVLLLAFEVTSPTVAEPRSPP